MSKSKSASASEQQETYTVLARRYRPQTFADLVGQEPVAEALTNALKSNRVAHAYVFTGARGVGKTSAARILAKCLNCEKGPTPTPCNKCENCQAITSGDDIDVLEIDGASNTSVDDVRELRGNVQFRPSKSRHKIYIIDEVHMLSKSAFNALLKTLEEPPPHVKFIFATTEIDKIPVTILSRCQRFDFAGIGTPRIVQRLKEIVESEGLQADEEALEILARRAGGSMRDAQSLLDQLLAFGGERLTVDQVHRLLGTASDERVTELAAAVAQRDAKLALELLGKAADAGLQLGELVDQLIAYWRDLMVVNAAGPEAPGLSVGSKHRPALVEQAKGWTLDTLMAGLDILSNTRARMSRSNHGRILVELALVRLGRLDQLVSLSQLAEAVSRGVTAGPSPSAPQRPAPAVDLKKNALAAVEPPRAPSEGQSFELTSETMPQFWPKVLAQLGQFLRSDLEKAGLPAICGPNMLEMKFPKEYNSSRDRCADPEKVGRIEQLLLQLTGRKCHVRIGAGSVSPNVGASAPGAQEPAHSQSRISTPREEAPEPPLVKWAKELLGAKPVRVDPGFAAQAPKEAETSQAGDREET